MYAYVNSSGRRRLLPTPNAQAHKSPTTPEGQARRERESSRGHALQDVIGGQLNPTWVEWLIGFPLGWTDLEGSGTP